MSAAIRGKPAAEWLAQLEESGIPAGPINSITQAFADVQARHRQMVRTLAGIPLVGSPVRLDGERADSNLPPPRLGEHTADVLAVLGVDANDVERLRAARVIS